MDVNTDIKMDINNTIVSSPKEFAPYPHISTKTSNEFEVYLKSRMDHLKHFNSFTN